MSYAFNDRNAACTKALFEERKTNFINRVCMFECHRISTDGEETELQLPLIQGIGHRDYIITNLKKGYLRPSLKLELFSRVILIIRMQVLFILNWHAIEN